VLPDPVPRDGERALARWGLLGEGAEPVFATGARYPLAGLLLALPALEETGLLEAARQVYGRLGCWAWTRHRKSRRSAASSASSPRPARQRT
jgi:hypothetical protein